MRKSILTCAVLAITLAAVAAAQTQNVPQAKPRDLRVMSYNIKHGQTNDSCEQPPRIPGQPPFADCGLDLQASIDVIKAHNPDIVGMQEIDRFWSRSGYVDEPAVIAEALGMNHTCYAPNLDHAPDANHSIQPHQYGTLIVSRFPIQECTNLLLRRVGNTEQRGLLKAVINVRGVKLQFYTTHLHTVQADRLLQTEDIAAAIDAAPAGPKVLVGDFNARSTATTTVPELEPIYARFSDAWRAAPVPDADNPQGFTSSARLEGLPTARIDYIFVSPDVEVAATRVPIDPQTRRAADHYPLVSEIALPGSAVGNGGQ
jgi:endonuclease/exonuclease/phosphatase family metal-dependent hydrolase